MKRISLTGGVCAAMVAAVTATSAWAGHVEPNLQKVIDEAPANEVISALVYLKEQVDTKRIDEQLKAQDAPRAVRHEEVVRTLRDHAAVTQGDLQRHLADLAMQGRVVEFKPFWIANFFHVQAVGGELERLADHPDVNIIYRDYGIELIAPVEEIDAMDAGGVINGGPEPGVTAVRAPEVWNLGYRGEGVLVANLDTGVSENHPALSSRWRGHDPAYAGNPQWAYFDPNGVCTPGDPCGVGSHGTHTMGTVCGGAPGDEVGVAPGAEWIAAAVIDIGGLNNTVVRALEAFEWMVDPDGNAGTSFDVPQTCSNSWGLVTGHGYPECDELFWTPIDNCEAVGIVVLFSSGNEGFSQMRRPADRATDDYSTTAVGAVDGNNPSYPIAGFSSRGPTNCTPGGGQAIKPEIAAPGVSVRSSVIGGGYSSFSGTSMASPHINGVAALMLQANPNLGVDEVKQIMYDTALDLGPAGNDNDYGHGMVDALAAVNEALSRNNVAFPTDYEVNFGLYQSGGVAELADSDDQYLRIRQTAPVTPLLPSIRLTVDSTAPNATASEILLRAEANSTALPATGLQRLQMYNYDTNGYEVVDERDATTGDSVVEVTISTNASRFIDGGTRDISTRIDWFEPANALFANWFSNTDQVMWEFTD